MLTPSRKRSRTSDEQVPELQRKADRWDELTTKVPGFTRAMVVLSDLVYHTNELVIEDLNTALRKRGLGGADFVAKVFFQLDSKYHSEEEKRDITEALGEVFGERTLHDSLRSQWDTVWGWKNKRLLFVNPIRDMSEKELLDLKQEIKDGLDYKDVRDVADLMLNMLLQKPVQNPADSG